jgi:hypothetical protein
MNIYQKHVIIHFETVLSTCADLAGKFVMNHETKFSAFRKEV